MKKTIILLLFACILFHRPSFAQSDTTLVTMPGTSIQLPKPKGFHLSDQFPGLIHEGSATTIFAMEKEGTPFQMVVEAMDESYFSSQQMRFISKEKFSHHQWIGVLFICAFTVDSVDFQRAILVTGDHNQSKIIIANYPEVAKANLETTIRECFDYVQF